MSDFEARIDGLFSLDSLEALDHTRPTEMAAIILGTYVINGHARRACQDILDQSFSPEQLEAREYAEMLVGLKGRRNLEKTAELLGPTALTVTALYPETYPMLYMGEHAVQSATGVPAVNAGNPGLRMAPAKNQLSDDDRLRIFAKLPDALLIHVGDWWDAQVINEELEPLVDIRVESRRR